MFWLKLLLKVFKLSLVYKLGLSVNSEVRKLSFELKKGGKVILREKVSSLDFKRAT